MFLVTPYSPFWVQQELYVKHAVRPRDDVESSISGKGVFLKTSLKYNFVTSEQGDGGGGRSIASLVSNLCQIGVIH